MMWVTLTTGMRGTFAVLMTNEDGFPEPVNTGMSSNRHDAIIEGKEWAEVEGIKYEGPER